MAVNVSRAGYPPHPAEAWASRWHVPATVAVSFYNAVCAPQGLDIIGCWDRYCIKSSCDWPRQRGYFDGTSWHIPEFRQYGIDWPQILNMIYAYGTPGWIIERFIWDNGRFPSGADINEYCRLAGIPYYDICLDTLAAFIDRRPDIWNWAMDCYAGTAWCKVPQVPGAKVGVFFAWWENMNPPERAQFGGSVHNFVCALNPSCQGCAAAPPPAPALDCSAQGKSAWAGQVGLPVCVADLFCQQFGRLPTSVSELTSWGTQKGIRCADGSWNCSGCQAGGTQPPGTQPSPGPQPPVQCASNQIAVPVINKCVDKNTALLVGGALALMLLVGGGRRR